MKYKPDKDGIIVDDEISFEDWIKQKKDVQKEKRDRLLTTSIDDTLVKGSIWILRGKDRKLTTESRTSFYLINFGLRLFQKLPLSSIRKEIRKIYYEKPEKIRFALSSHYPFSIAPRIKQLFIYVPDSLAGQIANIADDIGLRRSEITFLSLVYGLSKCDSWISPFYKEKFESEIRQFAIWTEHRLKDLASY